MLTFLCVFFVVVICNIVTCSSFLSGMNQRNGTDVDAGNVMNVFRKLGYTVKVYNDQTVAQIGQVLTAGMVHSNKFLYSVSLPQYQ